MLISGNRLLVANTGTNTIAEYNLSTGDLVNPTFITGVTNPKGLASSGSNLYISALNSSKISEYDLISGAVIAPSFINSPNTLAGGLAVSGTNLYYSITGGNRIGEADLVQGGSNEGFITTFNGTQPLAIGSVPEPSTWALLIGGMGTLFFLRRKAAKKLSLCQK